MKKSFLKILAISVVIVMLSAVSVGQPTVSTEYSVTDEAISRLIPAAVVWSDNFDDEDISDWQIFKVNHTASPDTLMPGNTSAEGGVMRHHETEWSYAGHNSSVAFGTWSFDIDLQDPIDQFHFSVAFISEVFDDDWLTHETVGSVCLIAFYYRATQIEFRLATGTHETGPDWLDDHFENTIVGWRNIIITRELSGQFYVYLNGNLIMEGQSLQLTTSERFYFLSHGGPAIDNITVSNSIDYDAAPPKWVQAPSNQMIDARAPFSYDLNATDYSEIDQWSINNTEYFDIDDNGVISNTQILDEGVYNLEVQVNDTLGNTQTGIFRVIATLLPTPFPIELIVGGVGITAVVILVLVIWKKRK